MKTFTIIFDLDDTLIPSTYKYHGPMMACGLIISKALGIKSVRPRVVYEKYDEIDQALTRTHGFATNRFPEAWVHTYEYFSLQAGLTVCDKVKRDLLKAASRFTRGPFVPFPGVEEVLTKLRRDGHRLYLVTAGPVDFQARKIADACLGGFFVEINIVSSSKKATLERIATGNPKDCVMVGDSKKSDIKPAIDLGMTALWVPSNTWTFSNIDLDPDTYFTIDSVTAVPLIVTTLAQE